MKKIRCPKCYNLIDFDVSYLKESNIVVFHCDQCGNTFKVRFKKKTADDVVDTPFYGAISVIENVFTHKQQLPLHLGDNVIGRQNPGNTVDCPIDTSDPSMDRVHCVINVAQKQDGLVFKIRDCDSNVGTFVMNDLLAKKEQRIISDGAVVTLGATTFILKTVPEG